MTGKPSILYPCIANSGRSAAAKVLTEHYGGDAVHVSSAGSKPGEHLYPEAPRC